MNNLNFRIIFLVKFFIFKWFIFHFEFLLLAKFTIITFLLLVYLFKHIGIKMCIANLLNAGLLFHYIFRFAICSIRFGQSKKIIIQVLLSLRKNFNWNTWWTTIYVLWTYFSLLEDIRKYFSRLNIIILNLFLFKMIESCNLWRCYKLLAIIPTFLSLFCINWLFIAFSCITCKEYSG